MGTAINDNSGASRSWIGLFLIVLGIALIVASWTPVGRVASQAMWSNEDSASYSKLRQQLHSSAYQSSARAGLTETEMKAQRERLEIQAGAMHKKLERAKSMPQRWSRYLLVVGCLLTVTGFYANATRRF